MANLIPSDSLLILAEAISTTLANEVWRLKTVQTECTQFSLPKGVVMSLLSL